jgi:predicted nucleotide-binding protein (sugar kinase/HSP70/actin superfamily)
MKITFPHLGNSYISVEPLLEGMGHEPITPPYGSKRTLELGGQLSPEVICLPFKIVLGNMLEGLDQGATGVVMIGGWGPCRLGYYGEVQRILLEKSGREIEFFMLEMPRGNVEKTIRLLHQTFSCTRPQKFWRGCQLAWVKLEAVECLESLALKIRPREQTRGTASRILSKYLNEIRQAQGVRRVKDLARKAQGDFLDAMKTNTGAKVPKVGLVGEIYTVIEPLANLNLEERLGELGVEVVRTISLQEWVRDHIFKKLVGRSHLAPLMRSAEGYLHSFIGGHGLETVAHSVDSARANLNGVIQILPLACMPEILAQGILPQISRDYNLPIMSLVVDEHSSETGFQTRLEAFVDLLERQVHAPHA